MSSSQRRTKKRAAHPTLYLQDEPEVPDSMHHLPEVANHPSSNQEEHIQLPTTDTVAAGQDSTSQVIFMYTYYTLFVAYFVC